MIATTFLTQYQMIKKTGWATDPNQKMIQRLMLFGVPIGLLFSGTVFPIGVVVYWVTTNLFSLGQQFYVLRKFPPPVNVDTGLTGGLFGGGAKTDVKKSDNRKTDNRQPVKPGARNVKNGKPLTNGAPVAKPTVAGPKVGAKPINPKKGNAAKRLSS
jgi:YidC/Oxa1 family membrane protein insertase